MSGIGNIPIPELNYGLVKFKSENKRRITEDDNVLSEDIDFFGNEL